MSAASSPVFPPHVHGWKTHVRATLVFLTLSIVVTGLAYPLLVTAIAEEIDPGAANGSLLKCPNGSIAGSADIAQNLSSGTLGPGLFWARPSLTDYDTTLGADTPPGPNDPALLSLLNETIAYLVEQNGTGNTSHNVLVVNAATLRIVASIPVGLEPTGVAVNASSGRVYVADAGSDLVSVVGTANGRVVASVPVGTAPQAVALDGAVGRLYVANFGSGNVSVVNTTTDTVVASVTVGANASAVAVDGTSGLVYVADRGSANVSVINATTDKVVASVPVGTNASGLAVDPALNAVFVANQGSANVSVINASTDKVVASIPVGTNATGVAVDAATGAVYVTNEGSDTVSVINGSTHRVVATIPVGSEPQAVAVDPGNGRVYVSDAGSDNVTVIDGATDAPVASFLVGIYPQGIGPDVASGELYVANWYWSNASLPSWWVLPTGSSVDPDLTPSAVLVQIPRVSAVTHLSIATLTGLVNAHITQPVLPDLGVPFVNVLELDIALLALQGGC